MICTKCNKEAPWVENKEIYGRNYGKSYMVYYCKPCDCYVGCHLNGRTPLGTMADAPTREARKAAHAAFDPLWRGGEMRRKDAYRWLRKQLGMTKQVHIAESDIEVCGFIIEIMERYNESSN